MAARRPFNNRAGLLGAARDVWFSLTPADWLEAFTHHPKIGDRESLRRRFAASGHLSEKEQAGLVGAASGCADEMLAMLRERLKNDPAAEIHIAAEEQAKITELRLLQIS